MSYFEGAQALFIQRNDEIDKFIIQVKEIENKQEVLSRLEKREFMCVVKSNIILMQYNLIESVFLELFTEFYQRIKDSNLGIDDVNSTFFYNFILLIRRMPDKNLSIIRNLPQEIPANEVNFSSLILKAGFELTEEEKKFLVNGNLDGRKVKDFLIAWGFNIDALESINIRCLKTLKDQRQLLAHGGNSFSEKGRTITWGEIDEYKQAIKETFDTTKNILSGFFDSNTSSSQA